MSTIRGRACAALALSMLLAATFLLAGAIGHDPWKPDEAYSFGLVLHILDTGRWVVPTLAGEPFMEKPPLYYATAALLAKAFSPWLALHDGARLASAFYVGVATLFAGLSARRLFGPGHGQVAALLLLGTFGIAPHSHEMITDTALLAGFSIAIFGLLHALDRPRLAGALLGTGIGVGFMSKGLVEPSMMGLGCLALPLFARYRSRAYLATLGWAALAVLPWIAIWPALLYRESPGLFREWFWTNNVGRYFGFAQLGADDEPWFYCHTLPWFTFPSGFLAALAAFSVWKEGEQRLRRALLVTGVIAIAIVVVLGTARTVRALYALPLLLPLAIFGSSMVDRIPRRWGLALSGSLGAVTLVGLLLAWWLWGTSLAAGATPDVALVSRWLPPGYRFPLVRWEVAFAALITVGWIAIWALRRASWLQLWSANIVALWGVYMVLLLPWIDNAKSFRAPFEEAASHMEGITPCVASIGLGEPQRAMLQYVAGIVTLRAPGTASRCRYLLVQSTSKGHMPRMPDERWDLVWEGARPGESVERFQLWEQEDEPEASLRMATAPDRATSSARSTTPAAPR